MEKYIEIAASFRQDLHTCPELAFQEKETKEKILHFLRTQTELEVKEEEKYIWARWKGFQGDSSAYDEKSLAFRADFDAVCGADGIAGHYCGHDGHSAILCAFAKYVSDTKPQRDIYFLFQPAEETGEGARECLSLLETEKIDRIYGFHNIPGHPHGEVLLREGTFCCASTGLEIEVTGYPSHAAYPENGRNPAYLISDTILYMKSWMEEPDNHKGMLLGTVIGVHLGSDAYGMSASTGTLRLTLRGEIQEEFDRFLQGVCDYVSKRAAEEGFGINLREVERFPATMNHIDAVHTVEQAANLSDIPSAYLQEPMRWSEDFGYYLQRTEGAFFGIGDGEDYPQLHTADYTFPDSISKNVLELYYRLLEI